MPFILEVGKENFKFSASHFAIFGPDHAELMHGHNYYVTVKIEADDLDPALGLAVDFNEIKPLIIDACHEWDERILFPQNSPYLKIDNFESGGKRIVFNKKIYVFPTEDVRLVDAVNISVEELSRLMWKRLSLEFKKFKRIKKVSVTIEETRGQRGTYTN